MRYSCREEKPMVEMDPDEIKQKKRKLVIESVKEDISTSLKNLLNPLS